MHVQVCTSNKWCDITVHICVHARCRVCICAHIYAVCSFSVGERGCGYSTSLWRHLLFGVGGYFWQKERYGCCLCFLYFQCGWERMRVYVCVYAHTHTRCTYGVLGCEPRSRDETPGGPKESGWTKSRHTTVYLYKVHMCMYMLEGGMRSWTNCFFLLHI